VGAITITATTSDTLQVAITSASGSVPGSAGRAFPLNPDSPLPVAVSSADAQLAMQLPADGRDSICAAAVRSVP
jgi:hypothetical protein